MILEIALGVFIGIVLAAYVLKNWQRIESGLSQLLAVSVWLLVTAVAVGILVTIGILVWLNFQKIAAIVGAIAAISILYGVPFWVYSKLSDKYPTFGLLIKGEPPWDRPTRLMVRLPVMAVFAVAVAGLGVGALMAGLSLVDYLDVLINGK